VYVEIRVVIVNQRISGIIQIFRYQRLVTRFIPHCCIFMKINTTDFHSNPGIRMTQIKIILVATIKDELGTWKIEILFNWI